MLFSTLRIQVYYSYYNDINDSHPIISFEYTNSLIRNLKWKIFLSNYREIQIVKTLYYSNFICLKGGNFYHIFLLQNSSILSETRRLCLFCSHIFNTVNEPNLIPCPDVKTQENLYNVKQYHNLKHINIITVQ